MESQIYGPFEYNIGKHQNLLIPEQTILEPLSVQLWDGALFEELIPGFDAQALTSTLQSKLAMLPIDLEIGIKTLKLGDNTVFVPEFWSRIKIYPDIGSTELKVIGYGHLLAIPSPDLKYGEKVGKIEFIPTVHPASRFAVISNSKILPELAQATANQIAGVWLDFTDMDAVNTQKPSHNGQASGNILHYPR